MLEHNEALQRADCHCHTVHSDGSLTTIELLDLAKEKQLSGLSITDHDTLAAYDVASQYAKELGIELVSGIEISTEHQRASVHVLGYAFDLQAPELLTFCDQQQIYRQNRNDQILERLAKINMPITLEEIHARFPGQGTIGRPHMAALMVEKGYVTSAAQAFTRYLGNKGRCYVKGCFLEVESAIDIIHKAGGFAVLAHPHYLEPKRLIKALSLMPFDGIEVFYGRCNLTQEKPWLTLAQEKNWLTTGGSDFHGAKTPYQPLGCSWTPSEVFDIFKKRFQSHSQNILPN